MNALNKENAPVITSRQRSKLSPFRSPLMKDDEEFKEYVAKGKQMMTVLQKSLIQTSIGTFILNSNLIPKSKETGCSIGPKIVLTKTRSKSKDCPKQIFKTLFNSKFKTEWKPKASQSQLTTTRETTARTRNPKSSTSRTFAGNLSDISQTDMPLQLTHLSKGQSSLITCRPKIKPIPFNLLLKKKAKNQSAVSIFSLCSRNEHIPAYKK